MSFLSFERGVELHQEAQFYWSFVTHLNNRTASKLALHRRHASTLWYAKHYETGLCLYVAVWLSADENTFPIKETFNVPVSQANNNFTTMYQVQKQAYIGLWEAGSILSAKAEMLLKNQGAYNASLNGNMSLWANETNLLWIVNNVVTV
jgi:hypothetical protein